MTSFVDFGLPTPVVRELSRHSSNWRATHSLDDWLNEAGIPVLEGIDTRRLTRHLRERGAMRGVVAEGRQPSRELTARLLASPPYFSGRTLPIWRRGRP